MSFPASHTSSAASFIFPRSTAVTFDSSSIASFPRRETSRKHELRSTFNTYASTAAPRTIPSRNTASVDATSAEDRHSPRARSAIVTPFGGTAARVIASHIDVTREGPSTPCDTAPNAKL
eukprot:31265-Pelagococcus_subviridis.AAC.26